ncbi:MAG TPA: amino acid adenylation domain-containing protein [Myxococcaceae bacterium]|jgi:amino acid adenylation domain-containing protein
MTTAVTLFEQHARSTPAAPAVLETGRAVTYGELDARAARLAHRLREAGVRPETLVGICVERSVEMIVGVLGILKAGGAYVPLDPAHPVERLSFILEDSGARTVVAQARRAPPGTASLVLVGPEAEAEGPAPTAPLPPPEAGTLAYVLYTSGSTGRPKGVMVEHAAVAHYARAAGDLLGVGPGDRVLQFASLSFDVSVEEILVPLTRGACVVLRTDAMLESEERFLEALGRWEITHASLPTSWWHDVARALDEGRGRWPECVRTVMVGGEQAHADALARWQRAVGTGTRLFNGYGPTEATITATVRDLTSFQAQGRLPIGEALPGVTTRILGPDLRDVPDGQEGELCLGGAGLARGYLHRPGLTADRFIALPNGERLYRTGDLARRRPDGELEVTGRADAQVKLRGIRIELGEIEATLRTHPGVRDAVVVLREDQPGAPRLVAYVTGAPDLRAEALRAHARRVLPEAMVPATCVRLDAFPLGTTGKVDRRALPPPPPEPRSRPPASQMERLVAGIVATVLGLSPDAVGADDNLFALGLHSLLAIRLLGRLRAELSPSLSLRTLFERSTVASLAEALETATTSAGQETSRIFRVPRDGELLPSCSQERVWFLEQLQPGEVAYQFQAVLRLRGVLDVPSLKRALQAMVERHEILRTTFPDAGGRPIQVIHAEHPVSLPEVDLSHLPELAREEALRREVAARVTVPFRADQLPLLRWTLFRLRDGEHALLQTEHHFVHDGWSFHLFLQEAFELYQAFCEGRPPRLEEPPIQFADYADWQRRWLQTEEARAQREYWRRALAGVRPLLSLPYDRPRPASQTYRGSMVRSEWSPELYEQIRAFSGEAGATTFMTMLAAYAALLHRLAGEKDFCVGTAVAVRRLPELEKILGMVVNTIGLRMDAGGDPTFREFLRRVREVTLDGYAREDLPFGEVVDAVQPARSAGHLPIYQVDFSFHNSPMPRLRMPGLSVDIDDGVPNGTSKFDLGVVVTPRAEQRSGMGQSGAGEALLVDWEYNADLFDARTVERLSRQFRTLLEAALADPDTPLSRLPLLAPAERRARVAAWTAASAPAAPPQLPVHVQVGRQAERTPDAVAVAGGGETLTYAELDRRAGALARRLRGAGVGPETRVGLFLERSPAAVVAMLATWKAGGAYVPLDPTLPARPLEALVQQAGLTCAVTSAALEARLPSLPRVLVDGPTGEAGPPPAAAMDPGAAAYVLFTSGSSGAPRGVVIEHRSVSHYAAAFAGEVGLTAADRVLQLASLAFDVSVEEVFPALALGAQVVVSAEGLAATPAALMDLCARAGVTVLDLPTAYWHELTLAMAAGDVSLPPSLRAVVIGTEAARAETLRAWQASQGQGRRVRLLNAYGPTEATVSSTWADLAEAEAADPLPIGRPLPGVRAYLLDGRMEPVPAGAAGELHLAGPGIARGYLGQPALTADRFVPDPFVAGERMYRTGDLVRELPGGRLAFLGRADRQVKVRGFRIELEEIEIALARHPAVREVVVERREESGGDARLVAWVAANEPPEALEPWLRERLPPYKVPAAFVPVDALPRNARGKVDRARLPAPGAAPSPDGETHWDPRDRVEAELLGLWREVLGAQPFSVRDDFFRAGGNSLLAVRLMHAIQRSFGRSLPVSTLFEGGTIEKLAVLLRKESDPAAWSPLVRLQAGQGGGAPLYCVHEGGGTVLCYLPLANRLGPSQPVYGFEHLRPGGPPPNRVEDMAREYVDALVRRQPRGPYHLIGRCTVGGFAALEMGRLLLEQGREVGLLALLATSVPPEAGDTATAELLQKERGAAVARELVASYGKRFPELQELLDLSEAEQVIQGLGFAKDFGLVPPDFGVSQVDQMLAAWNSEMEALAAYRPRHYPGRVTVFCPEVDAGMPEMDWSRLAGSVEVVLVPGTHHTIDQEPDVELLAQHVARLIAPPPAPSSGG